MPPKAVNAIERYELARSPFALRPTQRDVAKLLGFTREELRFFATHKEHFTTRRQEEVGKKRKVRDLKYPMAELRTVHERLKYHLAKIKQPDYLFSPRRNRAQRDNAALHLGKQQYLTLDFKQFYPSTTAAMVRRWLQDDLGMYPDVAGLLTHLCTIDGHVSFGSPLTPVLCTLVHRRMFDRIAEICNVRNLNCSLWVDDLTISGDFVPGEVVREIRNIIANAGLRSHKIRFRTGNRPVFITGIGVVGTELVAPNSLNLRIKQQWENFHSASTTEEREDCISALLTSLGTQRYICGRTSETGRRASNEMNSLRQKREKMRREAASIAAKEQLVRSLTISYAVEDAPFDMT